MPPIGSVFAAKNHKKKPDIDLGGSKNFALDSLDICALGEFSSIARQRFDC